MIFLVMQIMEQLHCRQLTIRLMEVPLHLMAHLNILVQMQLVQLVGIIQELL